MNGDEQDKSCPNETLLPVGAAGLTAESIVLCHQIRTLDKRRLLRAFGTVDDAPQRQAVLHALRFQLGLS